MVARLLLVLLTLAGPLPVRVCTCAASPTTCTDPTCPSSPTPAPERKTCGCGHSHHAESAGEHRAELVGDCEPAHLPAAGVAHQHPPVHQPDCPATQIQIRAAPTATVPTTAGPPDEPAAPFVFLSEPVASTPSARTPDHVRHRAPARPLFITLLTLRN
jgi:hypothetical protein